MQGSWSRVQVDHCSEATVLGHPERLVLSLAGRAGGARRGGLSPSPIAVHVRVVVPPLGRVGGALDRGSLSPPMIRPPLIAVGHVTAAALRGSLFPPRRAPPLIPVGYVAADMDEEARMEPNEALVFSISACPSILDGAEEREDRVGLGAVFAEHLRAHAPAFCFSSLRGISGKGLYRARRVFTQPPPGAFTDTVHLESDPLD